MLTAPPTDSDLVARVRADDAAASHRAFAEIDRRYRPAVRRHVARLLSGRPDNEDVTQDTMLRAYVALRADGRPIPSLRPWLLRIAHNRALDVIRAARHHEALEDDARAPRENSEPADVIDLRDRLAVTVRALIDLPAAQRSAIVLTAIDGEPYEEVARRLDVTPDAARALAYRGRATMRRELVAA